MLKSKPTMIRTIPGRMRPMATLRPSGPYRAPPPSPRTVPTRRSLASTHAIIPDSSGLSSAYGQAATNRGPEVTTMAKQERDNRKSQTSDRDADKADKHDDEDHDKKHEGKHERK